MLAVGLWYEHFEPTSDAEITTLLAGGGADPPPRPLTNLQHERIPSAADSRTSAIWSCRSPRRDTWCSLTAADRAATPAQRQVARALNERPLGTLLLDLLTVEEERDRRTYIDIELLAERLVAATNWAQSEPQIAELPVGYFGASTGAGAALAAAAQLGDHIGAVVSRGGRPDLAAARLPEVRAPRVADRRRPRQIVIELNREARSLLRTSSELAIVPRSHTPVRGAPVHSRRSHDLPANGSSARLIQRPRCHHEHHAVVVPVTSPGLLRRIQADRASSIATHRSRARPAEVR